ncbi:hypothetical protein F5X68DRAFT_128374 [Plectosphaerella plurivora]|uniref:Xylanolytic transcriptional activator regulatory domain-containing protein n=1 Tax=Plectosphaerella plurivora TaxID=936078 RepID=A0A9P8VJY0_9PEZI|nr:hypothetical protein F5X68DRAFT_128374 [Plectosphaerella plurivora]
MGTTIRAAQFIGLNQEAQWGNIDDVEKQARRYVWWSVFIGAGFISMSWGMPPMLAETDCNIRHPHDGEETSEQCPGFSSLEKREDGELHPVTIGSYNRYKADMYKIAISIMHQVYFGQHQGPEDLCQRVIKLHKRLLVWEGGIPLELRVESHPREVPGDTAVEPLRRVFALQALTLRVSYDNVQILLFRPLLSTGGVPKSRFPTRQNSPAPASTTQMNQDNVPEPIRSIAQRQCWTSATRTSLLSQSLDILSLSQFNFPAIHVGVHAFSAGVMLGLMALQAPLSARGQESKRGIARIVQIPKATKLKSHVWTQMTQVLTDLMHVIAGEETKALIANPSELDLSEVLAKPDIFGEPSDYYPRLIEPSQAQLDSEHRAPQADTLGRGNDFEDDTSEPRLEAEGTAPTAGTSGSVRQEMPAAAPFDPFNTDMGQSGLFDMSEMWVPPQVGWPAGSLPGMDQSWMWDWSFPSR